MTHAPTFEESVIDGINRILEILEDSVNPEPPPEPPPQPPPPDTIKMLVVPFNPTKSQVPLWRIHHRNLALRPVWAPYFTLDGERILPKRGKVLFVYPKIIKGDSRNHAYKVAKEQIIDGEDMRDHPFTFVAQRHVEVI